MLLPCGSSHNIYVTIKLIIINYNFIFMRKWMCRRIFASLSLTFYSWKFNLLWIIAGDWPSRIVPAPWHVYIDCTYTMFILIKLHEEWEFPLKQFKAENWIFSDTYIWIWNCQGREAGGTTLVEDKEI